MAATSCLASTWGARQDPEGPRETHPELAAWANAVAIQSYVQQAREQPGQIVGESTAAEFQRWQARGDPEGPRETHPELSAWGYAAMVQEMQQRVQRHASEVSVGVGCKRPSSEAQVGEGQCMDEESPAELKRSRTRMVRCHLLVPVVHLSSEYYY